MSSRPQSFCLGFSQRLVCLTSLALSDQTLGALGSGHLRRRSCSAASGLYWAGKERPACGI